MSISRAGLLAGSVLGVVMLVGCGTAVPPQPAAQQPLPQVAALDAADVSTAMNADDALGIDLLSADGLAVPKGTHIEVNRPFLFAITDLNTGLPLFLGRVADPS